MERAGLSVEIESTLLAVSVNVQVVSAKTADAVPVIKPDEEIVNPGGSDPLVTVVSYVTELPALDVADS